MLSTIATEIKDLTLSADGKEAQFILVTKYSGDITVTLPAACLQQLQMPKSDAPIGMPSSEPADGQKISGPKPTGETTVSIPKTWLVAADLRHDLVVVVLNHRMPNQYGFALDIKATAELIAAMDKQAEKVKASKTALSPL
jgi:hypothetical protein